MTLLSIAHKIGFLAIEEGCFFSPLLYLEKPASNAGFSKYNKKVLLINKTFLLAERIGLEPMHPFKGMTD